MQQQGYGQQGYGQQGYPMQQGYGMQQPGMHFNLAYITPALCFPLFSAHTPRYCWNCLMQYLAQSVGAVQPVQPAAVHHTSSQQQHTEACV